MPKAAPVINALVSGKLVADPIAKTSAGGRSYVKILLRVATSSNDSCLVSALCFNSNAEALLALSPGDPVSLAGSATLNAWLKDGEPHAGLNLMVNGALTMAHAKRKPQRKPVAADAAATATGADDWLTKAGDLDSP